MDLSFEVFANTAYGQAVYLRIFKDNSLNLESATLFPLECVSGKWATTSPITISERHLVHYQYVIRVGVSDVRTGRIRILPIESSFGSMLVSDDEASDIVNDDLGALLSKSAFQDVIYHHPATESPQYIGAPSVSFDRVTLELRLAMPMLFADATLHVCGSAKALGQWQATRALKLERVFEKETYPPVFRVCFEISRSELPLELKFVAASSQGLAQIITWEGLEENRVLTVETIRPGFDAVSVDCARFVAPSEGNGQPFIPRMSGLITPLTSLRSENCFGVGEFNDLKAAGDMLAMCGSRILQLLPISDTRVQNNDYDTYPYSPVCVLSLHPIYIHIPAVPGVTSKILEDYEIMRPTFESQQKLQYIPVLNTKLEWLSEIFSELTTDDFEIDTVKYPDVAADLDVFLAENDWVKPYAAFMALVSKYGSSSFRTDWPEEMRLYDEAVLVAVMEDPELARVYHMNVWMQCVASQQLVEASTYCAEKGVALMGDLPIGVAFDSVDCWVHPSLFREHKCSGAPPDSFALLGQAWGFPPYDWDEMAKDGYLWWRERLAIMNRYFSSTRVDHILGLFRMYENYRGDVHGLRGRYNPSIHIQRNEVLARFKRSPDDNGLIPRLCEPYITDAVLDEYCHPMNSSRFPGVPGFDSLRAYILDFLEPNPEWPGRYRFKADYFPNTQELIEARVYKDCPFPEGTRDDEIDSSDTELIKNLILGLHENVCALREVEDGIEFFCPRYMVIGNEPQSFRSLSPEERTIMQKFHDDYHHGGSDWKWEETGHVRIPAILNSTDLLMLAEDLGALRPFVTPVLEQYGVYGLRVQRDPGDPKITVYHPDNYPQRMVITPSTHDNPPLRTFMQHSDFQSPGDIKKKHALWYDVLGKREPFSTDNDAITQFVREVADQHFFSPASIFVLIIQDFLQMSEELRWTGPCEDEFINIPKLRKMRWVYRCHKTLEEIMADRSFMAYVREKNIQSGRLRPL